MNPCKGCHNFSPSHNICNRFSSTLNYNIFRKQFCQCMNCIIKVTCRDDSRCRKTKNAFRDLGEYIKENHIRSTTLRRSNGKSKL